MTDYIPDSFFTDLQMEQDISNYIRYDKVPSYLQKMKYSQHITMKNKCPALDDIVLHDYDIRHDYSELMSHIQTNIAKCDDVINIITMPTYEPDTCPVCLCEFEETNYVIPKCKHKVCAVCFTNNIKYNKTTGDCCVLCRKRIC